MAERTANPSGQGFALQQFHGQEEDGRMSELFANADVEQPADVGMSDGAGEQEFTSKALAHVFVGGQIGAHGLDGEPDL
ncbi:MAG: hypothetical protein ABI806_25410 [Candidatus Solibacter sp.]